MKSNPTEKILRPFRHFFQLESSSGLLLIGCLAVALFLANSSWSGTYFHFLEMDIGLHVSGAGISKSIQHWINDGLMAVFFFVVGLEIKREMVAGELASFRNASLPIVAALGGMIAPALIYTAFNLGKPGANGWGVPMATDIAFALGILSLLGNRVPASLKIFLAALAIIDDLGSVLVIAVFYTEKIALGGLGHAALAFMLLIGLNRMGVRKPVLYLIPGAFLWYYLSQAGIHGTIAGVLLAWTIPSLSRLNERAFVDYCQNILKKFQAASYKEATPILNPERMDSIRELEEACEEVEPPLQRLERRLHPWTSFLVLPAFALANAGVALDGSLFQSLAHPVSLGIFLGLVVGKPLGIFLAVRLALLLKLTQLPDSAPLKLILGAGLLGGIGFTMSIFIAGLAFPYGQQLATAKLSVLLASSLSGVLGGLFLHRILPRKA